jgi:hypothetical protein
MSLLNLTVDFPYLYTIWYAHQWSFDPREELVRAALHTLLAVLDYKPALSSSLSTTTTNAAAAATSGVRDEAARAVSPPFNLWHAWLSEMQDQRDWQRWFDGLTKLLNSVPEADNVYLPYSIKSVECFQEVLVLVWKLMDIVPGFAAFVAQHLHVDRLLGPILYAPIPRQYHSVSLVSRRVDCAPARLLIL